MVQGLEFTVSGVWCMVYGVWCMVYGVWCLVLMRDIIAPTILSPLKLPGSGSRGNALWCMVYGL